MIKHYRKCISAIFAAAVLSSGLIGCKSNIEVIADDLNSQNYIKAARKADSLINEDEKEEAAHLIENKIEEIKNQYISGNIDGTLAISDISKLKNNNEQVNKCADKVSEAIHMHMNSKKAFYDGVKFEEEGSYKEALESYHLVNEEDKENYEESKIRIEKIKEKLKNEEILKVSEAKVIVTSELHKDIYPDQMQVMIKNNGSSSVKKFEVTIFGYDADNNPVKIRNKLSETEDYPFLGLADNISIKPGELWGSEYGWSVLNSNIDRIEACIEYAQYDDGTVWDNELYIEWLKDHWVEE